MFRPANDLLTYMPCRSCRRKAHNDTSRTTVTSTKIVELINILSTCNYVLLTTAVHTRILSSDTCTQVAHSITPFSSLIRLVWHLSRLAFATCRLLATRYYCFRCSSYSRLTYHFASPREADPLHYLGCPWATTHQLFSCPFQFVGHCQCYSTHSYHCFSVTSTV